MPRRAWSAPCAFQGCHRMADYRGGCAGGLCRGHSKQKRLGKELTLLRRGAWWRKPREWSESELARLGELISKGVGRREIARVMGLGESTIRKKLRSMRGCAWPRRPAKKRAPSARRARPPEPVMFAPRPRATDREPMPTMKPRQVISDGWVVGQPIYGERMAEWRPSIYEYATRRAT